MKSVINELWHGNIVPQDRRTNSKEMKELLGFIARHHEDLEKSCTDEQKANFKKFHDCIFHCTSFCGYVCAIVLSFSTNRNTTRQSPWI